MSVTYKFVDPGTQIQAPAANNEPDGYTQITDQPFNSVTADSWYADGTAGAIISSASDAPESPSNAMRATYPAGHASGGAPIDVERSISASGYSEIYMRIVTRHDASWQGEASGTNKVVFLWIHGDPAFFLSAEGVDAGTLTPTMRLQNVPDARGSLSNNISSASITRGSWHTWEVQLIANTAGNANGVARLWFDRTLIAEHTDVEWDTAGGDTWQFIEINPTWGGNTPAETVDSEMYLDYDHCYASGA